MEKSFSTILEDFAKEYHLSDLEMAGIMGISQRMYKDYASGKFKGSKGRTRDYELKLQAFAESRKISKESEAIPLSGPHNGDNIYFIPSYAYGGFLQGYANKIFMEGLEKFSLPGIHGEHYAFQVQGDSMMPLAGPGDIVISRKEEQLDWMVKGRVYVLQTIDGILIKTFEKIADKKAYFVSINKSGSTPIITLKDIKGVYQVVKILKDFNMGG